MAWVSGEHAPCSENIFNQMNVHNPMLLSNDPVLFRLIVEDGARCLFLSGCFSVSYFNRFCATTLFEIAFLWDWQAIRNRLAYTRCDCLSWNCYNQCLLKLKACVSHFSQLSTVTLSLASPTSCWTSANWNILFLSTNSLFTWAHINYLGLYW